MMKTEKNATLLSHLDTVKLSCHVREEQRTSAGETQPRADVHACAHARACVVMCRPPGNGQMKICKEVKVGSLRADKLEGRKASRKRE
jgi:hypothetical protein